MSTETERAAAGGPGDDSLIASRGRDETHVSASAAQDATAVCAREHHAERAQAVVVGKIAKVFRESTLVVALGDQGASEAVTLQKWLDQVFADHELPRSAFRVAFGIGRGPTSITELAEATGRSRRTVQRCIAELVRRGHLHRGASGR